MSGPRVVVLIGPSRAGKTTVCREIISAATRRHLLATTRGDDAPQHGSRLRWAFGTAGVTFGRDRLPADIAAEYLAVG